MPEHDSRGARDGRTETTRPPGTAPARVLGRFLRDEEGTTAVEYAVMLGLIIIAALVGIASVGTSTYDLYNDSNGDLQAVGFS